VGREGNSRDKIHGMRRVELVEHFLCLTGISGAKIWGIYTNM
jgi:hypothetical protein